MVASILSAQRYMKIDIGSAEKEKYLCKYTEEKYEPLRRKEGRVRERDAFYSIFYRHRQITMDVAFIAEGPLLIWFNIHIESVFVFRGPRITQR